jgi:hypothetical protein
MKQVVPLKWRSKKLKKKDGSGLRLWDFAGKESCVCKTIHGIICTILSLCDHYSGRHNTTSFLCCYAIVKVCVGLVHASSFCFLVHWW